MQTTVITMKKASHYLLLCLLGVLVFSSCHKDDLGEENQEGTTVINPPSVHTITVHDVLGYVYDESNNPIAGVEIRIADATVTTNDLGLFVFKNAKLDRNGSFVKATKSGYILGSDMLFPSGEQKEMYSYIKMMTMETNKTFNASTGATIPVTGGGNVTFAPNTIVDDAGQAYTGTVSVTAKRLAADDPNMSDLMPGGLLAEDKDGKTRVLGTLGMVAVELRGESGQELNIAEGSTAAVEFPIAAFQQAEAPEQIELWYFDENKGYWIEEGFATKDGNTYKGNVAHFSFWNCDAPFPLVHVCGQVFYSDGTPATNLQVQVVTNAIYPTAWGYTNNEGIFCGKMPSRETLTITIFYPGCNDGYTFTVGPFSVDTQLDPITLPDADNTLISGTVVCNGTPVSSASVILSVGGSVQVHSADVNGSFSIPLIICDNTSEVSISAYDSNTGQASQTTSLNLSSDQSVELNVCPSEDCTLELTVVEGYTDQCDPSSYNFTAQATGASGNYSYLWSNGSTSETIASVDSLNATYCVTVTDADDTDCFAAYCHEFEFSFINFSTSVIPVNCDGSLGSATVTVVGGNGLNTISVMNGNQEIANGSNELTVTDLQIGVYTFLITDALGCTQTGEFAIEEIAGIGEPTIWQGCGSATINYWNSPAGEVSITYNGNTSQGSILVNETGTYCLDLTSSTGCTEQQCVDIVIEDVPPPTYNFSCAFPYYQFEFFGSLNVNIIGVNGETINIQEDQYPYSPLEAGYDLTLIMLTEQECEFEEQINLPQFNGLSVEAIERSCDTCDDGSIEITIDNSQTCISCNVGETKVYTNNNGQLGEEVTTANENDQLGSGEYFVVVLNETSGCIIAHQLVSIM